MLYVVPGLGKVHHSKSTKVFALSKTLSLTVTVEGTTPVVRNCVLYSGLYAVL